MRAMIIGSLMAAAIVITVNSCATLKTIGRTLNDAASIMCTVFATENESELDGLSPDQWCALHENLEPFIDQALTAKQSAGKAALGGE